MRLPAMPASHSDIENEHYTSSLQLQGFLCPLKVAVEQKPNYSKPKTTQVWQPQYVFMQLPRRLRQSVLYSTTCIDVSSLLKLRPTRYIELAPNQVRAEILWNVPWLKLVRLHRPSHLRRVSEKHTPKGYYQCRWSSELDTWRGRAWRLASSACWGEAAGALMLATNQPDCCRSETLRRSNPRLSCSRTRRRETYPHQRSFVFR